MRSRKNRVIRGSISAKMNILIVMIILIVSGLLMIISSGAYRRVVFGSLEQRLNSLEVAKDTFVPVSNHFSKVFSDRRVSGSQSKKRIRGTGRQPGCLDDCPAAIPSRIRQPVS